MSEEKDDKWLDELISQSIDTTAPRFDAEEWKARHPDALQSITSRWVKPAPSDQPDVLKRIFAHPVVGLAAAAAVIIVVTGLLLTRDRQKTEGAAPEPLRVAQSPAKIVSVMSLRLAYQRGGLDALDQQFRETLKTLGPGPSDLTMGQLLQGSNNF
jgi:hypothetical protein